MDDCAKTHEPLHDVQEAPRKAPVLMDEDDDSAGDVLHPDSAKVADCAPWVLHIPLLGRSIAVFGPHAVSALGVNYFFNKGLGYNLIEYSKYAMFMDRFQVSATRYQRLASITSMGFTINILPAALSDLFACAGYTKRWYCAAACLVGGAFTLALGVLPAKPSSADSGASFAFLATFCIASVDIMSEGYYSRMMRSHPRAGPSLAGWVWACVTSSYLVASLFEGPLSDAALPQIGVFVSAGSQVIPIWLFALNWYGEKTNREARRDDARHLRARRDTALEATKTGEAVKDGGDGGQSGGSSDEHLAEHLHRQVAVGVSEDHDDADADFVEPDIVSCLCGAFEFNRAIFSAMWRDLVVGCVIVCAVVAMTCMTILGDTYDMLYCAVVVTVVVCGSVFWACPLIVAKAAVFHYLNKLLYVELPGAVNYFFLASESCLKDGPHFSYVFFMTVGSVLGSIASVAGVVAFTYIFSKQRYALTFVVTTVVRVLGSIFDIIMVKRWNLHIGIPDHGMFILGDAIVYQVCYMLAWMPMVVLLSRICPRGSESIVYAIVAGVGNMGSSMSGVVGSLLMELVWPVVSYGEGTCDFSNVPMLLLVGHILLPLLVIPLSFLLLPSARICDNLEVEVQCAPHSADATSGEATSSPAEAAANSSSHGDGHSHKGGTPRV